MIKFSVIIPTHNRQRNIELNLTALSKQTLDKSLFEVIIVDDGSTDDTYKILEKGNYWDNLNLKYVKAFKTVAWNASRPRNFGAKMAEKTSEAFIFVDSDVLLNEKALEYYAEDFEKNKERVVIGPYDWTTPMHISPEDIANRFDAFISNRLPKLMLPPNSKLGSIGADVRTPKFESSKPDDLFDEVFDGLACFGGNLMFPRHLFWDLGGYDEDTHCGLEDGEMGIRIWKKGIAFSYDNRTKGYHAWHEIPPSRYPADLKDQIARLNLKHFNTTDPDYGLIPTNREFFKKLGIDWHVPPEWEKRDDE